MGVRRGRRAEISLLLASVLITLLLVEVGLRIARFDPLGRLASTERGPLLRISDNPERVYELTPGSEGFAWRTEVRVNSHGFRDREYTRRKPAGVFRIAVLGDSVSFGLGLAVHETYAERLEGALQDAPMPVEVLNLAVGGYDTLQEVATLEEIGLPFEPDLVVLGYTMNDLGVVSSNLKHLLRVARYRASPLYRLRVAQLVISRVERDRVRREMERMNEDALFLARNETTIADVSEDEELARLLEGFRGAAAREGELHRTASWYGSAPRVGRLRHSLERLERLRRRHGFRVVVLIVPYLEEGRAYLRAAQIAEHEASRLGFEVINLHGAFREAGFANVRHEDNLVHPNGAGHAIMAARLEAHLRSSPPFLGEGGGKGSDP